VLTGALVLLAISLPFGSREPFFRAGGLPLDAPAIAILLAVGASLWESIKKNIRPDAPGWSALALAGAWLVSSLSAHVEHIQSSLCAWELMAGPIIFACARPLLSPKSRTAILAALGLSLIVFIAMKLVSGGSLLLVTPPSTASWQAFSSHPLTGAGPGAFAETPLWTALLQKGGLLVAGAGTALLWALSRDILRLSRTKGGKPAVMWGVLVLIILVLSGFFLDPLASPAVWLALAVLPVPSRRAYNAVRRA